MNELKMITHEEHIDVDYYHIPNVNMIESLNLATVRDLNTQVVPGIHIAQGCIDSREDVIRAHIRFLIGTDVAVTDGNIKHPAPHGTYILPRILEEPEKEQDKKVSAAPPLEEDRDPFLDGDDDDDDCNKGKKKRRSASPAAPTNRRYSVRTSGQKKKKTK